MDKIALGIIVFCLLLYLLRSPIEFIGGVGALYIVYIFLIKPHQRTEEEEREAQDAIREKQAKEDGYHSGPWEDEEEEY